MQVHCVYPLSHYSSIRFPEYFLTNVVQTTFWNILHATTENTILRYFFTTVSDAIFTHSAVVDGKQVVLHIMDSAWHVSYRHVAYVACDCFCWLCLI